MVLAILFIFQMEDQLLNAIYFLFLGGAAVILVCIAAYIFPFGKNLRDNKNLQSIKAGGVDLKVNVITVFVLVGILMSSSGIYLYLRYAEMSGLQAQIYTLKNQLEDAERKSEARKSISVKLIPKFENADNVEIPAPSQDITCRYWIQGGDDEGTLCKTEINPVGGIYIKLEDITAETNIRVLKLNDRNNDNEWITQDLHPLEPIIIFKPMVQ